MKITRKIAIFCFLFMFSCAIAEDVGFMTHEEVTLTFTYGNRTGYYTGSTLAGLPDGYGCFETKNSSGSPWVYIGEFKNGMFNGEGMCMWPEWSESSQGIFVDGNMISGISRYAQIEKSYKGEFTSDTREDLIGKAYNSDGTLFFEGKIVNGICEEGTIYNTDGSIAATGTFGEGFSKFIEDLSFLSIFN